MQSPSDSRTRWSGRTFYGIVAFTAFAFALPSIEALAADELPPNVPVHIRRLHTKATTIQAEVERRVANGDLPQAIVEKMQKLDPFMQKGQHAEAEALLDSVLKELGKDPEAINKTFASASGAAAAKAKPASGNRPLPDIDLTGFKPIFNGQNLDGWDGDPVYWRVRDGIMLGTITPQTLLKENSWIVYRDEQVRDFELVIDYRVSEQGNSGVGYRLKVVEGKPFAVRGPQVDIHGQPMFTGITYEENGRRLLASRGQSTWIDPGGVPRVIAQIAHPGELQQSVVNAEGWNRYHVVAKGPDVKHFLNGVQVSEYHDYDHANRMRDGLIGVQVHVGPPMTIEYRNIYLKHLGDHPSGSVPRGSKAYTSGSLVEFEHQPTFANIEKQTKMLTAPRITGPIDGSVELTVVTRRLGVVRHDLTDVPVLAPSYTPNKANSFDLVVMFGDNVVRIPHAGMMIINKGPLDREYSVHLKWNAAKGHYEALQIKPASQ